MDNLKTTLNSYLGLIFKVGLLLVILSTLFLFTNLTTEFYETAKFLVLFIFTGLILILLTLRFTITGKVVFVRTPLDIPLLLLLAVAIVSTVVSPSPFVALLGNQLKVHGSLSSLIVYILFYFILVNNLKSERQTKWYLGATVLAGGVLAAISLAAYAGLTLLPKPLIHGVNFTLTGSNFSTTAILTMLLPIILGNILHGRNPIFRIVSSIILFLSLTTIVLTGNWATWAAASFALVVFFFIFKPANYSQIKPATAIYLIVPITLALLITVLSLFPPVDETKNPLYDKARNFPRELQLPFVPSWKISVSAFRDSPFWGSGPATYLFNFTNYKPIELNQTNLWNVRFDSAFNEYLETLANLGGVGAVALLSLTALFINSAYRTLKSGNHQPPTTNHELSKTLAIAGLTFFLVLALYPSTLPLWVFGVLILASFMVANTAGSGEKRWGGDEEGNFTRTLFRIAGNLSSADSSSETVRIDALPGILLVSSLALVLSGAFFAGRFTLADYHHRKAVNAVAQNNGVLAYNELVASEKLNPYNDLYRTDLAQVNFALANAIALAKGPTEASPGGSLTDQDKQNIQVLLQQSINEARNAVTLSPKSAINWEVLGLLYRQISGVAQNALVFSLDSYGRAIQNDSLNPILRLNVGGVYYTIKNYDLAIRFFTDAINLKSDYANAFFNLSVALRDKGDLSGAVQTAQQVVNLITDQNSQDYKTAQNYLNDLKNRIASGSAQASPITAPEQQNSGTLQKKELPKVLNLPKPEKIATPEAVKKPEPTPTPSP
ncbi:O-antigen ligase family protein [Candidatus Daviesbacteria bacterium]|nr:O-antigen ligase family protein [Candidatus Daviesbacteria bacterium]